MTTEEVLTLLSEIDFTLLERRLLGKLVCGKPCPIKDLVKHVYPNEPLADGQNLTFHVKNIRKKIGHLNHTILCECVGRKHFYRYVLLVVRGDIDTTSIHGKK